MSTLFFCLDYLTANGFTNYIASGGGRDFMRPISNELYGIPRERVIGSATTFKYASNGHYANFISLRPDFPSLTGLDDVLSHHHEAASRH